MARSIGTLTLDLVMKTGGLTTGAAKAKREVNDLQKSFVTMGKAAGIAAGAFVGTALVAGIAAVVRETKEAQQEQAQLAAVLKSTGQAAGYTQASLNDMADAMEKATAIDGGDITKAQTALLAFTNIAGKQFPAALQAAADMSARTGMTIQQTSELIGRALDVPSQGMAALSKQGFRFSEEQKKVIKALEDTGQVAKAQDIILKELQKTYGGAAEAARNTLPGAFAALQNSVKNLLTGDDASFAGATKAINDLADTLSDPQIKSGMNSLIAGFTGIANAAVTATARVAGFIAEIPGFWKFLTGDIDTDNIGQVTERFQELEKTLVEFNKRQKSVGGFSAISPTEARSILAMAEEYKKLGQVIDDYNKKKKDEAEAQKAATAASIEIQKQNAEQAKKDVAAAAAAEANKKRLQEISGIIKDLKEQLIDEGYSWDKATVKKLENLKATDAQIRSSKELISSIMAVKEIQDDSFGINVSGGYQERFNELNMMFDDQADIEWDRYQRQLKDFEEYSQNRELTAERSAEIIRGIEEKHAQILEDQNKNSWKNKKDQIQSTLGTISTLMNSESKKAFNIGKVAAIANASIATFEGATQAYKAMSGIPVVGPALGAAAAAAVVAAGAMNISAIKSTSFGGGGGVSSGGMSNTQGLNAMNTPVQNTPTQRTNVTLVGDFFSREGVINMLNAAQKDGFTITGQ